MMRRAWQVEQTVGRRRQLEQKLVALRQREAAYHTELAPTWQQHPPVPPPPADSGGGGAWPAWGAGAQLSGPARGV